MGDTALYKTQISKTRNRTLTWTETTIITHHHIFRMIAWYLAAALVAVAHAAPVDPDLSLFAGCEFGFQASPTLKGRVDFRVQAGSSQIEVKVNVTGLATDDGNYAHGLHVHEFGQTTPDGCDSMSGHWNPDGIDHGAPFDPPSARHPGDFGNILEDGDGNIKVIFTDPMAALSGEYNIAGHGLVLHEHYDDLGRGGTEDSIASGDAGSRIACCAIVFLDGSEWN